jgi:hypothetical protein
LQQRGVCGSGPADKEIGKQAGRRTPAHENEINENWTIQDGYVCQPICFAVT